MPIKLSKAFARRKSTGNELEPEFVPAAEPTFRVLNRSEAADNGRGREDRMRPVPAPRHNSSPLRNRGDDSFDGGLYPSKRTNNSDSTAGTTSSARHSTFSTQPSSVASSSLDELSFTNRPSYATQFRNIDHEIPYPNVQQKRRSGFRQSIADKAFSLARPDFRKAPKQSQDRFDDDGDEDDDDDDGDLFSNSRNRSYTTSSYASSQRTARPAPPPRLDIGPPTRSVTADAVEWYERQNRVRDNPIMEEPQTLAPPTPPLPVAGSDVNIAIPLRKQYSFEERPQPLSSRLGRSPPPDRSSPISPGPEASRQLLSRQPSYSQEDDGDTGLGIQDGQSPTVDLDTELLMDAAYASEELGRRHAPPPPPSSRSIPFPPRGGSPAYMRADSRPRGSPSPVGSRGGFSNMESNEATPRSKYHDDEPTSLFRDAPQRQEFRPVRARDPSPLKAGGKVMTPAEFERYKRTIETAPDDDERSDKSDESELYEDEDDGERTRQMMKQRKRQEANLAVYRQQMMKVAGEDNGDSPAPQARPALERATQSTPNLVPDFSQSNLNLKLGEPSQKFSDDEDDDVPLGVLQAHGFPNKNRPPTRMTNTSGSIPRPVSQLSSYPAPAGSTRHDPSAGGAGGGILPVFARHLPVDPYAGAGLVNQSRRESLPYGTGSRGTPPTNQGQSSSGGLPPGGLVGVIAGEERSRAMRRGSPSTNGTYGPSQPQGQSTTPPQMTPSHSQQGYSPSMYMQQGMAMPQMMAMQPMSLGEQSQVQMNNQMTQMMQMQMQWMQHMMQNMGNSSGGTPSMADLSAMMQQQAQSGAQGGQFLDALSSQNQQQRESMFTSSTVGSHNRSSSALSNHARPPSMFGVMPANSTDGIQGRYAPSIAPSERSNVGQPSRYRPVTPAGLSGTSRSSNTSQGAMPGTSNQFAYDYQRSRSSSALPMPQNPYSTMVPPGRAPPAPATIRIIDRPKRGGGGSDDEEDDAGWAEMKRKREERKGRWKPKKQQQDLEGMEALYYDA